MRREEGASGNPPRSWRREKSREKAKGNQKKRKKEGKKERENRLHPKEPPKMSVDEREGEGGVILAGCPSFQTCRETNHHWNFQMVLVASIERQGKKKKKMLNSVWILGFEVI